MQFVYTARKESGEEIKGTLAAADRFELARLVKERGAILTSATANSSTGMVGKIKKFFSHLPLIGSRASGKDLMLFSSNLGALLAAGLTLSRSLTVLARQTKRAAFKTTIEEVNQRIGKGMSLHAALEAAGDTFPPVLISMVAAGEESGTLAETFKLAGEQINKSYELKRKIRGALIYPTVIISVIIIIAALMMIFLVPTLAATFKDLGVDLPLSTQIIIGLSNFLVNYWYLALAVLILIIFGGMFFFRRPLGKKLLDHVVLALPLIGPVAHESNAGAILRTASSLLSAGVPMVEALDITAQVARNGLYQAALRAAGKEIEQGLTLSAAFKTREKLFPPLVGELTEVGEETGELSAMMLRGALFYEGEVDQVLKNLSTIIEPALMIVVGIAVGFFAIAMIGPMYSLANVL